MRGVICSNQAPWIQRERHTEYITRLSQRDQSVATVRSRFNYLQSYAGGQEKEISVTELLISVSSILSGYSNQSTFMNNSNFFTEFPLCS